MGSAFGAAGQRCLAGSVAVLVGDEERQDEVARRARWPPHPSCTSGPGADDATDVCALVGPDARERVTEALERGRGGGRRGRSSTGATPSPAPAGTMLGPTIVDGAGHESELAREELFGPLLTLVRVPDLDGALEFVNGSPIRQRRLDLHHVRRRRPRVPLRRRGGDDRRQRRGRRADRLVPVLRLEGLDGRRPPRQRRATRSSSTRARRSSPPDGADGDRGLSGRTLGAAAGRHPRPSRRRVRAPGRQPAGRPAAAAALRLPPPGG